MVNLKTKQRVCYNFFLVNKIELAEKVFIKDSSIVILILAIFYIFTATFIFFQNISSIYTDINLLKVIKLALKLLSKAKNKAQQILNLAIKYLILENLNFNYRKFYI